MPFLAPLQAIFDQAPVFVLVLARISGLVMVAPLLGSNAIPMKIKALVALVISMAVFPLVSQQVVWPSCLLALVVSVGGELLIGLSMGFIILLLFVGIQLGAEMVSYQMGLAMSRLVDPTSNIDTNVLSQFYLLLVTVFYVLMNGHLVLVGSLLETFGTVPLMGLQLTESYTGTIVETVRSVLTGSFVLGVRIAGPALVAIFLATLAMGFVSRTMPQLNILAAGFPVRIMLAFVLLIASIGTVSLLFKDGLKVVFGEIGMLFI